MQCPITKSYDLAVSLEVAEHSSAAEADLFSNFPLRATNAEQVGAIFTQLKDPVFVAEIQTKQESFLEWYMTGARQPAEEQIREAAKTWASLYSETHGRDH